MLIGPLARPPRDDADLIQRQPALPHPAAQRGNSASRRATVAMVCALVDDEPSLPGHQRRHRPRTRGTPQLVAIHLGDDLHDAPIDRVALTGQLRQLLEQHLKALIRAHRSGTAMRSRS